MATEKENPLFISWHDSNWIPMLNPSNILDYFGERSNPFYDRTCNNEVIKMQRLSQDQLSNMTGVEYVLLHAQEPILYIVRKQHRHSPQQVTPLADYYIIAGIVYQAPDLCSVINSRLLNAVFNLQTAFEEAHSYARYHPSRGYWWEFHDKEDSVLLAASALADVIITWSKTLYKSDVKEKKKDEPSSIFQRQRVDLLLGELAKKFPPKFVAPSQPEAREEQVKVEPKLEVKQEKAEDKSNTSSVKPPPEKKPKLIR